MENMTMPAILIDINLVWQIINFCVIMFIFKKKLFGPVSRIISERKALITKDMDDAKKDKEEAEKSKVKAEAELKKAKAEALKILVEAEKKSEERKDAILKDAHAQREKMIKSGEAEVEKHGKAKKIIVFKYRPKKKYRRKQGHRQPYTKLVIKSIKSN